MIYGRQRASSGGAWTANYYLSDRLSVRLTLDASGNVVGRQGHQPYGEEFAGSGTQQKHHFTSYERDGESNLDYAINRSYVINAGRFLQADPYKPSGYMKDPQSWNRYTYVGNNPVDWVDPIGLMALAVWLMPPAVMGGGNDTGAFAPELIPIEETDVTGGNSDHTDILIAALKNLLGQCISDFGGAAVIAFRMNELDKERGEIHFHRWDSNDPIHNGPDLGRIFTHIHTASEYWQDRNDQEHTFSSLQPAARTVAYHATNDDGGIDAQTYSTIITGPSYDNPALDAKGLEAARGDQDRYRQIVLLHEYLHLLNNLNDQGLYDLHPKNWSKTNVKNLLEFGPPKPRRDHEEI